MGWTFDFFAAWDGLPIRWGFAPSGGSTRGTVLLLNGRTEFMEKYGEVADEMNRRGFDVYSCDWRGQGLSGRMLADRRKGHVVRFEDYLEDLDRLVAIIRERRAPTPFVLLGHSMGGHLALRYLAIRPALFARAVLSSPMIDIRRPRYLPLAALRWVVRAALRRGRHEAYALGAGGASGQDCRFEGNRLTCDRMRFERSQALIRREPRLAVGGVTYGWLAAALQSIETIAATEFARSLQVPLLMVTAAEDRIVCPRAQVRFCRELADGRMICIRGARHELLVETDDYRTQFWRAWDEFLAPLFSEALPTGT